jgi:hypothetical protein
VFAVYVFFNWLPTVLGSVGFPWQRRSADRCTSTSAAFSVR